MQLPLLKVCGSFIFRESKKACDILWFTWAFFAFLEVKRINKYSSWEANSVFYMYVFRSMWQSVDLLWKIAFYLFLWLKQKLLWFIANFVHAQLSKNISRHKYKCMHCSTLELFKCFFSFAKFPICYNTLHTGNANKVQNIVFQSCTKDRMTQFNISVAVKRQDKKDNK